MKRLADKLKEAGWVEKIHIYDKPTLLPGSRACELNVKWSDKGRKNLLAIWQMIREVESVSRPIQSDEMPWIRTFAELAAKQSGEPPPS